MSLFTSAIETVFAGGVQSVDRRRTDRRTARRQFRVPDRRTGFDRRKPAGLLGVLRDSPAVLVGLLVLINLFSIADWVFTMQALQIGAVEGNPVLAMMLTTNPAAAFAFKVTATLLVTLALWTWRRYRLILATAAAATLVYAGLMVYHAAGLNGAFAVILGL